MNCLKCKSIVPINSNFCSSCGAQAPVQAEKKIQKSSKNRFLGFLIFLLFIGYVIYNSGNDFEGQSLIGGKTMYTSCSLNVRSKPSVNGYKIKTLSINTKIIISKDDANGWVFIGNTDSIGLGFVSSKYLQAKSYSKGQLEQIKVKKNKENARKKQSTPVSSSEDLLAYNYAQDFVKQRLKSPGSAIFPGIWDGKREHITKLGNREYRINSYVDSQNGFGSLLRTNWSCIIYFDGDKVGFRDLSVN